MPKKSTDFSKQAIKHVESSRTLRIQDEPENIQFLHSCFCQIAIPRSKPKRRTFEHKVGNYSLKMEAGSLYDGRSEGWIDQELPYGVVPRLILIYISTYAKRNKTKIIEVGDSMKSFLGLIGIQNSGGKRGGYTSFKQQARFLAACNMSIGFKQDSQVSRTVKAPLIESTTWEHFDLWAIDQHGQKPIWQTELTISQSYYEAINEHSVPLDSTAIAGIQNNALALDLYFFMAHRLPRLSAPLKLSTEALRRQFCPEYKEVSGSFTTRLNKALARACNVYPEAKVKRIRGGVLFMPSKPAIKSKQFYFKNRTDGFTN
jgi:hypothetical protein